MRRFITILFIAISCSLYGTKYYVDTGGVDDAGRSGAIGQEWASLSYACTRVSSPDTVYINAGAYNEGTQVIWNTGVRIDGAGQSLVTITATGALNPIILASSAAGTNGNQSISNITINGDSLAVFGIRIYGRSNVSVHDITIRETVQYGLTFADQVGRSATSAPTSWATGNRIYNLTMVDCGRDSYTTYWEADGAIDISGQDGMLIYDFDIDNKTGGRYAYGIKGLYGGGWHKGLKIFNGKIRTNIRDVAGQQSFGFNIELWTGVGGIEIYNIDGNGAIDMGGYGYSDNYSYGYAFKIYNNVLKQDSRPTNQPEAGLILESGGEDGMYFYRNWVENFTTGLTLGTTAVSLTQGFDNVQVYYNVFANIGYAAGGVGAGVEGYNLTTGVNINNLKIYNNVFHKVSSASGWAVSFESNPGNNFTDVFIKNNIIYNCYNPFNFNYTTIDVIQINNNLVYGNTINTPDYTGSTVTNNTFTNNQISVDPLFESVGTDYRLNISSTAIDAGVDVGLTSDFVENIVPAGAAPDMGAYEFMSSPAPSTGDGIFAKDRNGLLLKDKNGKLIIL